MGVSLNKRETITFVSNSLSFIKGRAIRYKSSAISVALHLPVGFPLLSLTRAMWDCLDIFFVQLCHSYEGRIFICCSLYLFCKVFKLLLHFTIIWVLCFYLYRELTVIKLILFFCSTLLFWRRNNLYLLLTFAVFTTLPPQSVWLWGFDYQFITGVTQLVI